MKIAFTTSSVSRQAGGLHEAVLRLAQSMTNGTCQVSVFGLQDEFTNEDASHWAPIEVQTFPVLGPRQFGYAPEVSAALKQSGVKLVMSHGLWMYPSAAVNQWHSETRQPYVVHPHGMLDPWAVRNSAWKKRLAHLFYEKNHLQNAACIRALCESEAQAIRAYGLKNPIAIIPNGIDLPAETSDVSMPASQRLSILPDHLKSQISNLECHKMLLYLGRIHPKKGLVNLIRAWAAVQKSQRSTLNSQPWLLAIAGWDQGGHEAELKQLATELNLPWLDVRNPQPSSSNPQPLVTPSYRPTDAPPSLVFLGPQFGADKAACYRTCDAFILPSFSEGLPIVVLEAWAHAKPVLMTPECNLPEGVTAGAAMECYGSVQGIEQGLEKLLSFSDTDRSLIGRNGRALVLKRYTWSKVAEQMMEVNEWIIGVAPRPATVRME